MDISAEINDGSAEIAEFSHFETVRVYHPAVTTTVEIMGVRPEEVEAISKVLPTQPVF